MRHDSVLRLLLAGALTLFAAGLFAGCATTSGGYDDEESDLPWATPETWEGSPLIPGFENR